MRTRLVNYGVTAHKINREKIDQNKPAHVAKILPVKPCFRCERNNQFPNDGLISKQQ